LFKISNKIDIYDISNLFLLGVIEYEKNISLQENFHLLTIKIHM